MKALVIADPLEKLKPQTDSTLGLIRHAPESCELFWCGGSSIEWQDSQVLVSAREILSRGSRQQAPECGAPQHLAITDFSCVLIRREPPFDAEYLRMLWWLWKLEPSLRQFNRASSLLSYHEKIIPYLMLLDSSLSSDEIFTTGVFADSDRARAYVERKNWEEIVVKPMMGFGGLGIQKFSRSDLLQKLVGLDWTEPLLFQEFDENIYRTGDRRVLYLEGEVLGDFVRLPGEASFISNLSRGGVISELPWTPKEEELSRKCSVWLKREKILFAGADFLGGKLGELNITCPTGLVQASDLSHKDLFNPIWKVLESPQ